MVAVFVNNVEYSHKVSMKRSWSSHRKFSWTLTSFTSESIETGGGLYGFSDMLLPVICNNCFLPSTNIELASKTWLWIDAGDYAHWCVVFLSVKVSSLKSKLPATHWQNLVLSSFGVVSCGKPSYLVTAADLSNFINSAYEAERPSDDKTSNSTFHRVAWWANISTDNMRGKYNLALIQLALICGILRFEVTISSILHCCYLKEKT